MKYVDVISSTYVDSSKEINNEDLQFKIGDILRISKYRVIFAKSMKETGMKKLLWLKKRKTLVRGHMLLVILKTKKLLQGYTKKNWQRQLKNILDLKK